MQLIHLRVEKVDFIAMHAVGDWTMSSGNPVLSVDWTDLLLRFLFLSIAALLGVVAGLFLAFECLLILLVLSGNTSCSVSSMWDKEKGNVR
jgi:hypothetical protein